MENLIENIHLVDDDVSNWDKEWSNTPNIYGIFSFCVWICFIESMNEQPAEFVKIDARDSIEINDTIWAFQMAN